MKNKEKLLTLFESDDRVNTLLAIEIAGIDKLSDILLERFTQERSSKFEQVMFNTWDGDEPSGITICITSIGIINFKEMKYEGYDSYRLELDESFCLYSDFNDTKINLQALLKEYQDEKTNEGETSGS